MPGDGVRSKDGLPRALIVAGPTCSGKSALALALALRLRGTVINADSMQSYRDLRVLTARPSPAEEAAVPHVLYGVRAATDPGTAAGWRENALAAMVEAREEGRLPILCGGTGLYLSALTQGIAAIPEPMAAARAEARGLLASEGPAALHAMLHAADPATAATLRPLDGQRLARAWEVWRSTGRGLVSWHKKAPVPAPWSFRMVLLDPPRAVLREAIAGRFAAMLEAGALAEAAALQGLDPALPLLRAHGVPELLAHLRGEATLVEAGARTVMATGRYTKRQMTWFRHRTIVDPRHMHTIHARYTANTQFSESVWCALMHFIKAEG